MVYDLKDVSDIGKFLASVRRLVGVGACVELTEKRHMALNQNKYLHIVLGVVAIAYGETVEDVKEYYFKRLVNPQIFIRDKILKATGEEIQCVRSTRDLTVEELSTALDRFIMWASQEGIYIPPPDDERIPKIEVQVRKLDNYL